MKFDFVIVGAGFAGSVIAERVASQLNKKVLVIEKRNHIGGNTYDCYNDAGILVQKYGPHIFHTNNKNVWDYLALFTEWNSYTHKVVAEVENKQVPLPINLETMERLFDQDFTSEKLEEYFNVNKIELSEIKNSRDVVVSQVGEKLYDLFFKNYTKKQWGVYPEELDPQVTRRIPVRFDRDTRYFSDSYQGIPKYSFTKMFEKMLNYENINILLNTDYKDVIDSILFEHLVFTGPIDYFFDYKFGKLPYRSLEFTFETLDEEKFQDFAVVNYPNDYDYTRITEFKYFYQQEHSKTTICYERPCSDGDPYYPIPRPSNDELYLKYKSEADKLKNTYFVGRLAQYKYLNMDQVIANALDLFNKTLKLA